MKVTNSLYNKRYFDQLIYKKYCKGLHGAWIGRKNNTTGSRSLQQDKENRYTVSIPI